MTVTKIDASTQIKGVLPSGSVPPRTSTIQLVIDGSGNPPPLGSWGNFSIPFACTVTGWVLTADQAGSAVINVERGTFSGFPANSPITGGAPPTLASQIKAENLNVAGVWTTAMNAGDVIEFELLSVTTCTRLNLSLNITIP